MRVGLTTRLKLRASGESNLGDSVSNKAGSGRYSLKAKLFTNKSSRGQPSRVKLSNGDAPANDSPPGAYVHKTQSESKQDPSPDEVTDAAGLRTEIISLRAAIFTLDAIIVDTRDVLSTTIQSVKGLSLTYRQPTNAFIFDTPEHIEQMCYVGATHIPMGANIKGTVHGTDVAMDSSMAGPISMLGEERHKRLCLPPKVVSLDELRYQLELLLLKEAELVKARTYFEHRIRLWRSVETDLETPLSQCQLFKVQQEMEEEEAQIRLREEAAIQAALIRTPFGRMAEGLLNLTEREKHRRREEKDFCVRGVTRIGGQKGFLAGAVGVATTEIMVTEEVMEKRDSGVELKKGKEKEFEEEGLPVQFLPRYNF